MTRIELKSAAKEQIKGKIGVLFVITLIIGAIGAACAFIPVIGRIGALIITPAFDISLCMIYLKLTKNEEISVGDTFSGFNITGKAIWLKIITQRSNNYRKKTTKRSLTSKSYCLFSKN